MADKTAPTKSKAPSAPRPGDTWRSGRPRFSLLGFWRGQNKEWHFFGQLPGEVVRLVVRKHWWFLAQPALPLIGATLLLFLMIWGSIALPGGGTLWYLLEGVAFIAMLITGGWFAYKDLVVWWYDAYIITDKRIISVHGLLEPQRKITGLDKVQQVGLDMNQFLGLVLGFGVVHIYLAGTDQLLLRDVPNPSRIRDAIIGIKDEIDAGKSKGGPPAAKPSNREVASALDKLAKQKAPPKLEDADEHLPPLRNSERFRGPRRTFGGILRIPCNVRYLSNEYTVMYIQRSRYVLWNKMLVPVILFLILFPIAILAPSGEVVSGAFLSYWWFMSVFLLGGLLIWMGLTYANYVDDVYILTNRRIIDIQRFFIFLAEKHQEVEYEKIVRKRVLIGNVVERFFDVGDVFIETPGASTPNIVLDDVDHPFFVLDEIDRISNNKKQTDAANKENRDKQELYKWFSDVVTALEKTALGSGVPDLRKKDLLTAMDEAQKLGLDVVVSGEAISSSHMEPGCVLQQNPPPGTMMKKGEGKIEVTLSRRPVPVDY